VTLVAVVGTGSAGLRHLKALGSIEGVQAIAVPLRSGRVRELESKGYTVAADVRAARDLGAECCIVASATSRHLSDVERALDCGQHVLVEKPMAANTAAGRRMQEQAATQGLQLFVGCNLRFSDSLRRFRRLMEVIGAIHSVRIECQSYLPDWRPERPYLESYSARVDEGGVLRDLVHEIDYACWLFGWPEAVQAKVRNLGRLGISSDESADLLWETAGGVAVSMTLDYLTRPPRRIMRAFGSDGTLSWDGIRGTVDLASANGTMETIDLPQSHDDLFRAQDFAFAAAVTGGAVSPDLATASDGVRALAVCEAARIAAEERRERNVEGL
jgi:predicted dehydrogenase